MKALIITILLGLFALPASAQKEVRQQVRVGNKQFKEKHFQKAEVAYRKGLSFSPEDAELNYNLANTLYRTERGEESAKIFQKMMKEIETLSPERGADVAHNAGNLMMAAKDYATAVDLYKESLRRRPTDDETRYNLALAQKLLEEQENGGGGGNDENNQEDQQSQDQDQSQDQNQEPREDNQRDNKPMDPQNQQEQQMSKDNAEKILDAYLQEEKETQRKIEQIKQQQQKQKRSRPKNW